MTASVVIRTHNEAPRLRLTLASLENQQGLDEVVVVDDGSTDATGDVLAAAKLRLPLRSLHHAAPRGRSAASNAGAAAATGALLIFLDGDTLAGPGLVARHLEAHRGPEAIMGRGETWHLRCTRFLSDPQTATFWPHERAREAALSESERAAMCVTERQVRHGFDSIAARAAPAIYPGIHPRRLYDAEMAALQSHRDSDRLWAAASGSNLSLARDRFVAAGGFHPGMDINEHRELAYRLCRSGARLVPVDGARSYHLTHRDGWRDPLQDDGWERSFVAAHAEAPVAELKAYWSALAADASPASFFAPG
ncbi:glycosyltransferase family 2 protein [Novosphingobium lentum]|uniref:glycosyltransferase family 2 protein n=1 Tax=Novosphingobium lentum TaxID=145287 RepID=UPI0008299786|nr:glycosyltransferase family 2 protein [Novosphingobium lentum]